MLLALKVLESGQNIGVQNGPSWWSGRTRHTAFEFKPCQIRKPQILIRGYASKPLPLAINQTVRTNIALRRNHVAHWIQAVDEVVIVTVVGTAAGVARTEEQIDVVDTVPVGARAAAAVESGGNAGRGIVKGDAEADLDRDQRDLRRADVIESQVPKTKSPPPLALL